VLGTAILKADANFAGLARQVAVQEIAPRIQAGQRVWYSGQWALTWYAEQAGASCFTIRPPSAARGDILIAGEYEFGTVAVMKSGLRRTLLCTIGADELALHVMDPAHSVAFFSNEVGVLPWQVVRGPVNRYYVWKIE
jgi:hypothetical protein